MESNTGSSSLTRCLVDGEHAVDLGEMQDVVQRIRGALGRRVPGPQQPRVSHALLCVALQFASTSAQEAH